MKNDFEPQASRHWLSLTGILLSGAYVLAIFKLATENSNLFNYLKADGWATFISGIFSPLAFFWLVLGFFQQGHELRQSAEALRLQGEELRHSVEQQKALVDVTKEQFEHERGERLKSEEEAKRLAQPKIGVQSNGFVSSVDGHRYDFLLANAGATVTSVRLMEGMTSFGEAATWTPGAGLSVAFSFAPGELLRSRTITISFNDGHGIPSIMEVTFPAVERNGQITLLAPDAA